VKPRSGNRLRKKRLLAEKLIQELNLAMATLADLPFARLLVPGSLAPRRRVRNGFPHGCSCPIGAHADCFGNYVFGGSDCFVSPRFSGFLELPS
jgi:hypothetical protein